jgi:hypothetical protein
VPEVAASRGALRAAAAAVAAGAALGLLTRISTDASGDPSHLRAAAALTASLGIAACAGAVRGGRIAPAAVAGGAFGGALAASAAAGHAAPGAALVVAGVALCAHGVAAVLRRFGAGAPGAAFTAAAIAVVPSLLLFAAAPWVDAGESGARTSRAQLLVNANPVAALCSDAGGAGVEWLRRTFLYDGFPDGSSRLTMAGDYAVTLPSAWAWGAAALGIGIVLALAGGSRNSMGACSSASS